MWWELRLERFRAIRLGIEGSGAGLRPPPPSTGGHTTLGLARRARAGDGQKERSASVRTRRRVRRRLRRPLRVCDVHRATTAARARAQASARAVPPHPVIALGAAELAGAARARAQRCVDVRRGRRGASGGRGSVVALRGWRGTSTWRVRWSRRLARRRAHLGVPVVVTRWRGASGGRGAVRRRVLVRVVRREEAALRVVERESSPASGANRPGRRVADRAPRARRAAGTRAGTARRARRATFRSASRRRASSSRARSSSSARRSPSSARIFASAICSKMSSSRRRPTRSTAARPARRRRRPPPRGSRGPARRSSRAPARAGTRGRAR